MSRITDNRFPHSAPFRPPEPDKAVDTGGKRFSTHWQRWCLLVAIGTALLLASVAAGVLLGKRGQLPASADVSVQTPKAQLLEALGSLSASHLYQSYLNIGMLGDAVEKGGCSLAQANDMLATVVNLMHAVDQQLDKLASAGMSEEDKADVEQIQQLSVLLKMQVASLRVYWLTNDGQDAQRYQQAREKSWTALSEVLGLEQ